MKTPSYLRISVALVTMTIIACSDPIDEPPVRDPGPPPILTNHGEYYTSVTTWTYGDTGNYVGLVTQTMGDLATVDVFVFNNGKRIPVGRELDATSVIRSHASYGEYYWASYKDNVLLLNYIGLTAASTPPYPLEVIIVY